MKGLLRIAFLSIAVMLVQGTWALAGVTGTLTGTVVFEGTTTPVADAKVTASAPSQTSTGTTDSGGHFVFVSLIPDTYTVTASKTNVIEDTVQRGVTVVADQSVNVAIQAKKYIKTLATVTTRAGGTNLVQPGTTANVYSVDARAQARTAVLGGSGGSDQGYSALAALPGAYIAPGQAGWFQTVNIRGGDYDQVGYEFDGVPVNRSFDNYPTTNLSAIGQQELQIYTGAAPAAAEGQGLAGYINQVIKSGTYPGFGTINLGIGGPSLYNKASFELGGATPDRNFSYYIGVGIINQNPRYYDNSNGVSQNATLGLVYDMKPTYANGANSVVGVPVQPNGYYLGAVNYLNVASLQDRENVFNFHIGIPHHNDSGKDDIQLLYDAFDLRTGWYDSPGDWGSSPSFYTHNTGTIEGTSQPLFFSGAQYIGPVGQVFTSADPTQVNNVVPYAFPSEGAGGFLNGTFSGEPIANNDRGNYDNGNGIYKIQYQHNIGTTSYLRVYGYAFYSWWYIHDPMAAWNLDYGLAPDYELWSHTRGGSINYVNQLSPHHLLNIEGTYSTASTVRDNNTQMFNLLSGSRGDAAQLVSAADPTNGFCYNVGIPDQHASCLKGSRNAAGFLAGNYESWGPLTCGFNCPAWMGNFFQPIFGNGFGIITPPPSGCNGPCAWLLSEDGRYATFNTVTPRFWAASIQDTWKPNDRLDLNIGVRENIYTFVYTATGGGTRAFWFNAWNNVACVNPIFNGGNPIDETLLGFVAGTSCSTVSTTGFPAGSFAPATLTNSTANGGQITFPEFEPRIAGTYTFGPDDVLRFSAGRYTEPANSAFQQYNSLDQDLPEHLLGTLFYRYGFTGPSHIVRPSVSYNYDLSIEHRFANTNTSFRLTPFFRKTLGQVQQLYIAPTQAFVSGLNVGNETNYGAELLLNMGNFNANGLSGQLSYTYTKSYIKYSPLPNGGSVVGLDNIDIQHYNSFTSACVGAVPSTSPTSLCGVDGSVNALATFPCVGVCVGTNANPYFNAPSRPLLDPNAQYEPYDIVPVGVQLSSIGYVVPHVAAFVVQWKHDKWSIIPGVQFHAGQKYGAPETTYGFDPSTCSTPLASPVAGDPRYPFGGTGGAADASTCGGQVVIPDPFTGNFDAPGAFTEPNQLTVGLSIQYEATPRISYQVNLANIVNTCFGGSKEPWTVYSNHWCLYGSQSGFFPPVGNFFNPGDTIQPFIKYPYFVGATGDNGLQGTTQPFAGSFNVQIKL